MRPRTIFIDENEEPPSMLTRRISPPSSSQKRSQFFRKRFFPNATIENWNDWHWQIRNRITTCEQLEKIIRLSENEKNTFHFQNATLPLAITPYYAALIEPDNPEQPIRRTMVPISGELVVSPGEAADPLGEVISSDGRGPLDVGGESGNLHP